MQFDDGVAERYDQSVADMFTPAVLEPTIDFLVQLCGDGAALEFAVGTGRVAIPLAARGVRVHGLEISPAMVARMKAKPGAEGIDVTIGDMARDRAPGRYRVVYLVFNTITNLTTQVEQVACFTNAAAHLEDGGFFIIEVGVPDLRRLPPGETVRPFDISAGHLGFDEYTDLVAQRVKSHHYWFDGDGVVVLTTEHRYVWPSELDLMAELAGMSLHQRWADWGRARFNDGSGTHVSVWQKSSNRKPEHD